MSKILSMKGFEIAEQYAGLGGGVAHQLEKKVENAESLSPPTKKLADREMNLDSRLQALEAAMRSGNTVKVVEHKLSPDAEQTMLNAYLERIFSHLEKQQAASVALEERPRRAPVRHEKMLVVGGQLVKSPPPPTPRPTILAKLELSYDDGGTLTETSRTDLNRALREHMRPGRDLNINTEPNVAKTENTLDLADPNLNLDIERIPARTASNASSFNRSDIDIE